MILAHTCAQISDSEFNNIVAKCRVDIAKWIENDTSAGRKASKNSPGKEELINIYLRLTRFGGKRYTWPEALKMAAQQLKPRHTDIENMVKKNWLDKKRSPEMEFVNPKAYEWLLHLDKNPPKGASWFPEYAVKVAHEAFMIKGKIATFYKKLRTYKRWKLIPVAAAGLC